jgi:RHS repeat-associated protein
MQVTSGSTTTTTTYLSHLEESTSVNGDSAAVTGYFYFGVQRLGEYQNSSGAWYDLLSDSLSSTTVVVNSLGVVAAQLFAPYGQARWAGGTMPTSYAFTGQRADSTTGLDYYGARYYDPVAGTFTSADTVLPDKGFSPTGLNRYGYVSGNPETLTDPTGHYIMGPGGGQGICKYDPDEPECQGGGGSGRGGGGGGSGSSGGGRGNGGSNSDGGGPPKNPCGAAPICATGPSGNGYLFGLDQWGTLELTGVGWMGVMQLIRELEMLEGKIDSILDMLAQAEAAAMQQSNQSQLCNLLCVVGAIFGGAGGAAACLGTGANPWVCGGAIGAGILGGAAGGDWLAGKFTGSVDPSSTPAGFVKGVIDGSIGATINTLRGLYNKMIQAGPNGDTTSIVQVDELDTPYYGPPGYKEFVDSFNTLVGLPPMGPIDGLQIATLGVSVNGLTTPCWPTGSCS